jgi:predicted MPP superfamily phosphohydrolase
MKLRNRSASSSAAAKLESWAEARNAIADGRYWIGPSGRRSRWRKLLFNGLVALFTKGIRLTPLYERGRRNALNLRVVELEVTLPELPPKFDGCRILHVSDTHLDVFPELADVARQLLDGIQVDVLVLTGDVQGDPRASVARSTGLLAQALSSVSVRGPRLAVLGNHDSVVMVDALEMSGFEVLINRSIILEREDQRLRITGLDDVHFFYTESARTALDEHEDECRIALVHSPEMADHADAAGYGLYLCGHTHGGQICLPGGRPLVTQLTRCRHAASGLWRQGQMTGYTSSGLGVSGPPIRFNSQGGMAIITLRGSTSEQSQGLAR